MTAFYRFTCSCGETIPLETTQAGQEIRCPRCGTAQTAPTFLQIKKLPPLADDKKPDSPRTDGASGISPRLITFLVGGLTLPLTLALFLHIVFATYPKPEETLKKDVFKTWDGRKTYQDGTPLPYSERLILQITPAHIEGMSMMESYMFLDTLGDSPVFDFNFWENYQALQDAYTIRCVVVTVLLAASVVLLIVAPFLPRQLAQVGQRGGTTW